MRRIDITPLIVAVLFLWTSVQNPVFATSLFSGQAYGGEQIVEPVVKNEQIMDSMKINQNNERKTVDESPPIKEDENSIDESAQEKRSMQIIPSSTVNETNMKDDEVKEKEVKEKEVKEKENQAFLNKILNSDVTRLDLRKPSGLTEVQAHELLKGTGLEGLGKAFVDAENTYHVNAYYLIAHAAWESGWGKSKISREKNNLFGFMAYDDSPYESAHGFASKAQGIARVAKYVSENYLDEKGDFYHGPHLSGMNVNYATDTSWKQGIGSVMIGLAKKTKSIQDLGRV